MPGDERSITFSFNADDKEAQKKLSQLRKDIERTQSQLGKSTEKHNSIVDQLNNARNAAEETRKRIAQLQKEYGALVNKGFSLRGTAENEQILADRDRIREELDQQKILLKQQEKDIAPLERREQNVLATMERQTEELKTQTSQAGELERTMATQASGALPDVRRQFENINTTVRKSIRNILKWGFGIRSTFILMRRLRSAITEGVKAFAEYDDETKQSINSVKGALSALKMAWGAAFAPIFNAVAPALNALIGMLTRAGNAVANFFAVLTGKGTYKTAIANQEALTESVQATGGAAKQAQKYLSGLDEMARWQSDSGGGGGGGSNPFEEVEADENSTSGRIAQFLRENLESVSLLVDEFIFVIGMILAFSGANIPLGIAMMVVGGYRLYRDATVNWEAIKTQLQGTMGGVMAVVNTALLVIGAILAFSGANIPLGIGLMAVGAAGLATVAVVNWDTITQALQGPLANAVACVASALLVVGILCLVAGFTPLGIGLIVAGAGGLAAPAAANWDNIIQFFKDGLDSIKDKVAEKWKELSGPVWDGFKEGLKECLKNPYAWLYEHVFLPFINGIKQVFGIASPAETMIEPGKMVGEGLLEGIKGVFSDVKNWVQENILDKVQSAIDAGKELYANVKAKVTELIADAKDTYVEAKAKVTEILESNDTYVKAKAKVTEFMDVAEDIYVYAKGKVSDFVKNPDGSLKTPSELWASAKAKFNEFYSTTKDGVKNWGGTAWANVKAWFNDAYESGDGALRGLGTRWANVKAWFNDAYQNKDGALRGLGTRWANVKAWFNDAYEDNNGALRGLGGIWANVKAWFNSSEDHLTEKQRTIDVIANVTRATGALDRENYYGNGNALGGAYYGGKWHDIPQYARGGRVHGSYFLAGEAGPEIVGHVGGRTEVLNQSQLASTMFAAVSRAMSSVRFQIIGLDFPQSYPMPLMATGTVTPPRVICDFDNYNLDDIVTRLDRLLMREERPIEITSNIRAEMNGREVMREVVRQGANEQTATGKNPFEL